MDADTAFALYGLADAGLTREQLTDCAVLRSAGATCEEAAVLILDSEDAAQTTMTALDGYIQNQIDTNKDYRPEEIPKLESAWTSARANTVLLVVAEDLVLAHVGGHDGVLGGHGCREELKLQEMPIPRFKNRGMLLFLCLFYQSPVDGNVERVYAGPSYNLSCESPGGLSLA